MCVAHAVALRPFHADSQAKGFEAGESAARRSLDRFHRQKTRPSDDVGKVLIRRPRLSGPGPAWTAYDRLSGMRWQVISQLSLS